MALGVRSLLSRPSSSVLAFKRGTRLPDVRVTGTLDQDSYDFDNAVYPTWPNPGNGDQEKIDDLWHASVNGRGTFLSASSPTELVNSLLSIMQNIESRIGSASSVSVNGDELYERLGADIRMFQSSYSSDGWYGDVKAYTLDEVLNSVYVCEPLRLYEICPVSTGAAALIITADEAWLLCLPQLD